MSFVDSRTIQTALPAKRRHICHNVKLGLSPNKTAATYPGGAGETSEEAERAEDDHEEAALARLVEDVRERINDGRVDSVDNGKLKDNKMCGNASMMVVWTVLTMAN